MYLKRVELKNIKGFGETELDFCPNGEDYAGWAVVTGDNGSGKSALLRAISMALVGPDDARQLLPDLRGWVKYGEAEGRISVEIRPDHQVDTTQKGGYPTQGTFWAEVELTDAEPLPSISSSDVRAKKKKGATNGPWAPSTGGWFAAAYGPFRRLYGTSPDAQRVMMIPGRIPRFGTLFREDATLGEAERWVQQLQYKKTVDQLEPEARALDNLLTLVRDEFLRQEGMTVAEVTADGLILRDHAGQLVPLRDMSEGYRSAIAMLIDIVRHMVGVYGPDVVSQAEDGRYVVDRPGVVLIDEIDAHLHPDWQREIGFWLKAHFPAVQFIVTTHSPLVCPAADGGRIYHLPQAGTGKPFQLSERDYNAVRAGKPDEILITPAFGLEQTRSPEAVRNRDRHALLVSKRIGVGLSETEEAELAQLELFTSSR